MSTIEQFLSVKSSMSESGRKSYRSTLRRFDKYCDELGISPIKAGTEHVADYLSQFEDSAYKTRKTYFTVLKSFYSWSERRGFIKYNPCDDVIVQGNARKQEKQFLSDNDFQLILSRCEDGRAKALVYFMFYTGVRAKELVNIKVGDVDLANHTIWVGVSKSASGNRSIPIAKALYPVLSRYLMARMAFDSNTDWLFLSAGHNKKMSYRSLLYYIKRLQDNLDIDFAPHDFRRSAGTRLYRATKDIVLVQRFLGHSSVETTRKYILGVDDMLNQVKSIDF